jgi:hypothetical protein
MSDFDEKLIQRLTKLEREVERLKVKESPIMSNYLLTTGKAADSDKLDGLDSTAFGQPVFLTTPLTSTDWDGDAYSTASKTLIDLSSVFGAPAGIKAVLLKVILRDSASSGADCAIYLSPNNISGSGMTASCERITNDVTVFRSFVVPCDSNGDIYYQTAASGSGTLDVWLEIHGYWV